MQICQITEHDYALLPGLTDLLIDVVHKGASVGFLTPLAPETARAYWIGVLGLLGPTLCLWVAEEEGKLIGTVQMAPSPKENSRHRADIQKLLVHSDHRGQGIASKLLSEAEAYARSIDRTLLVLDTEAGSHAEKVYQHLGWQRAGEIPEYAACPDGRLHATVYYYKKNVV